MRTTRFTILAMTVRSSLGRATRLPVFVGVRDVKSKGRRGGERWVGRGGAGAPVRLRGIRLLPVEWNSGANAEHIPSFLIECPRSSKRATSTNLEPSGRDGWWNAASSRSRTGRDRGVVSPRADSSDAGYNRALNIARITDYADSIRAEVALKGAGRRRILRSFRPAHSFFPRRFR